MNRLKQFAAGFFLLAVCSAAEAKPPYLVGGWGGPNAAVSFNGGLGEIQLHCASGTIDNAVYPAKDGSFQAKGTYREGTPGPVRVGQIFRVQPATYSGTVTKDAMTLSVELDDGSVVGPFTLTLGAAPQLARCR